MRASVLLLVPAICAMLGTAHADSRTRATAIAGRWIDAAQHGDRRSLARLDAPGLTVIRAVISEGSVIQCHAFELGTPAARARFARAARGMFDGRPGLMHAEPATRRLGCSRATLLPIHAGDTDVELELSAIFLTVRVSKAGTVRAVMSREDAGGY